jgi:hypothetical protein
MTREQAINLRVQKRKAGWQVCPPHWTPPPEFKLLARRPAGSMGGTQTAAVLLNTFGPFSICRVLGGGPRTSAATRLWITSN